MKDTLEMSGDGDMSLMRTRLDDLVPNPSCVYEALQPILASCETPDNIGERTRLSIRLSLCEFMAANVDFPSVCFDTSRFLQCTQQLETRPTWWTTFSGNYQHIPVICAEHRPDFEARKALKVFKDASYIMESYESEIEQSLSTIRNSIATTTKQWEFVSNNLSVDIARASKDVAEWQYATSMEEISRFMDELNGLLQHTTDELRSMSGIKRQFQEVNDAMELTFSNFEVSMERIENQNRDTAGILQDSATKTASILSEAGETLNAFVAVISIFAGIIKVVWAFAWPIACIATVVAAYMVKSRYKCDRGPRHHRTEESPSADLLYY